jgi:hypothetical protein
MKKPEGYENDLGSYGLVASDRICGEPIAWGFKLVRHLGDDRFNNLRKFGILECYHPNWYLIVKTLTREEAIEKYGPITNEEFGPRGGWRSVTFGNKKFGSDYLRPPKTSG